MSVTLAPFCCRLRCAPLTHTRASWSSAPSESSSSSSCCVCPCWRETPDTSRWEKPTSHLPHDLAPSSVTFVKVLSNFYTFFFLFPFFLLSCMWVFCACVVQNNEISKDDLYSFFDTELKRETPEELMYRRPLRKSHTTQTCWPHRVEKKLWAKLTAIKMMFLQV